MTNVFKEEYESVLYTTFNFITWFILKFNILSVKAYTKVKLSLYKKFNSEARFDSWKTIKCPAYQDVSVSTLGMMTNGGLGVALHPALHWYNGPVIPVNSWNTRRDYLLIIQCDLCKTLIFYFIDCELSVFSD